LLATCECTFVFCCPGRNFFIFLRSHSFLKNPLFFFVDALAFY
jgi:hypothetical protein